jgi:uncharacterized membrane protein
VGAHHHHDERPVALPRLLAGSLVALVVLLLAATVAGAVLLWPSQRHFTVPAQFQGTGTGAVHTVAGSVTEVTLHSRCGGPDDPAGQLVEPASLAVPTGAGTYACTRAVFGVSSGPDRGKHVLLEFTGEPGDPVVHAGDQVRLVRSQDATGVTSYYFADFARGLPLTLLAVLFAVVVVLVARLRGFAALLGIGVAIAVLVWFVLPALLDGEPPLPVALVAGAAIMFCVLYLAHGISWRTTTALLGTLGALAATGLLSWAATKGTHLTGLQDDQNTAVQAYAQHVQLTGLLLAGFVIGSLGVLNDVTVTQASAAFELAGADPTAGRIRLFSRTMRIGRDHIASTVYTLVLCYAGSALPVLLLFDVIGRGVEDTVTSDVVADEVVRSLVGGIGLVLAVPLTTMVAAAVAHHRVAQVDHHRVAQADAMA